MRIGVGAISCLVLSTVLWSGTAVAQTVDAHEHGHGALNIAVEGKTVLMELEVPGADIVGFEHDPKNDAEREKIAAALAILEAPLDLFLLPSEAGCSAVEIEAERHGDHGEHSEFHAEYRLVCDDPKKIDRIRFAYFETFPGAEELEIQLVTDKGAKGFEVERGEPELDLGGSI